MKKCVFKMIYLICRKMDRLYFFPTMNPLACLFFLINAYLSLLRFIIFFLSVICNPLEGNLTFFFQYVFTYRIGVALRSRENSTSRFVLCDFQLMINSSLLCHFYFDCGTNCECNIPFDVQFNKTETWVCGFFFTCNPYFFPPLLVLFFFNSPPFIPFHFHLQKVGIIAIIISTGELIREDYFNLKCSETCSPLLILLLARETDTHASSSCLHFSAFLSQLM